jgi:hypothetical protein
VPYSDPGPIPEFLLRTPRRGNGQTGRVPPDPGAAPEDPAERGDPAGGVPKGEVCAQCGAAEPDPLPQALVAEGEIPLHRECLRFWLKDHPQPTERAIPLIQITEIKSRRPNKPALGPLGDSLDDLK